MKKPVIALLGVLLLLAGMLGLARWTPLRDAWDQYAAGFIDDIVTGHITVTAHFEDTIGLYVGNEVTVLGMPVGEVTGIEPSGTKVVVQLEVDDDVKVPANVTAVTVSPSVVTNRNVELTPAYRGGPVLADGDLIPRKRTRTPVEIDRVISAVDELAAELSKTEGGRGVISEATEVAAKTLKGNGKRIRTTFGSLAAATDSMSGHRDTLLALVRDVDRLTESAADNKALITSFSENLTEVTELFADEAPELSESLKTLNGLLDEAEGLLEDNSKTVKATLRDLRTNSGTLAEHTGQLAESIDVLPLTFQNLLAAVDADAGELRVHTNPDQIISDQYQTMCDLSGTTLPGCEARTLGALGPDLGITALLREVIE